MTGPSTAKPFPEARPPHLPDVVTRQSPWAFVFAVLALIELVFTWRQWSGQFPSPEPDQAWLLAYMLIPSVVYPLLGFVLFIRRPDARRSMPLLVLGLLLLCALTLMSEFDPQVFGALVGDSSDPVDSPILTAYIAIESVLRFVGLIAIAAGLAAARTEVPSRFQRPLAMGLGVVAGGIMAVNLVAIGLFVPNIELQASLVGIVLTLLASLAWVYLLFTTVAGWMADERPRRAWAMGALAVSYLIVYRLFGDVTLWFGEAAYGFSQVATYVSFVAWLVLLVAFAIGLPSPPTPDVIDRPVDAAP